MGQAVSKDGWITNTIDVMPFGGFGTAPYQPVAGNEKEAVKAVVGGLSGGPSAVLGLGIRESTVVGMVSSGVVSIPFTYINNKSLPQQLPITQCQRHYNPEVTSFMSLKPYVFVNRWGFSLSADDNGNISHSNRYRHKDGWQGWVIEHAGGSNVFLSRNQGNGHYVLAINDDGEVLTTSNRMKGGWEEFEMTGHPKQGVVTFRRVREPRFYLACSNEGYICATLGCNLEGWEAWIPE